MTSRSLPERDPMRCLCDLPGKRGDDDPKICRVCKRPIEWDEKVVSLDSALSEHQIRSLSDANLNYWTVRAVRALDGYGHLTAPEATKENCGALREECKRRGLDNWPYYP